MRWLSTSAAALVGLVAPTWLLISTEPTAIHCPPPAAPPAADDSSCAICHPGPTKGLRQTPHAALLTAPKYQDRACTACHGDLRAHVETALDPAREVIPVVPVDAQACAACHGDDQPLTAAGAHGWVSAPEVGLAGPTSQLPSEQRGFLDLDWAALIAVGYRFVDVRGSRERYDTDINLSEGLRMPEFELEGLGAQDGWASLVRLRAENVGDPYVRGDLLVEKTGTYRGRARLRNTEVKYLAAGDYHRVVTDAKEQTFDLSWDVSENVQVFGGYTHLNQDQFWLTNRIGNRNLNPLTTVPDVNSPRGLDSDLAEVGISGRALDTSYTLAFEYRDDDLNQNWNYDRPSPVNPAFNESEDFTSRSRLRGPGGRFTLAHGNEDFSFDVSGLVLSLDREVTGDGTATGFDISEFVSTTSSRSTGDAFTFLIDATLTYGAASWLDIIADVRYAHHTENFRITQDDTIVYPTLGTSTTITTDLDQRTKQRQFEGSLQFDVEPTEGLVLTAGYLWSREYLEVPDLQSGDNDFVSGDINDNGGIFGLQWRPNEHWVIQGEYRQVGQNGVQLYAIQADRARRAGGKVRFQSERFWAEGFAIHRQRENDIASSHTDNLSAGLTTSVPYSPDLDVRASYVWSDIDSQTLTNFYFDPDPNPVPTFVGFQGRTNTVSAGFDWHAMERLNWRFDGVYTDTRGSFDIRLWDLRTDLAYRVIAGGEAGVRFRYVDYNEAGGIDDYRAVLTMLYWRQRL